MMMITELQALITERHTAKSRARFKQAALANSPIIKRRTKDHWKTTSANPQCRAKTTSRVPTGEARLPSISSRFRAALDRNTTVRCLSSTSSWSSRLTEGARGSRALDAGAWRKRSGGNPFRGVRAFAARGIMGLRAGGQSDALFT